jgi:hypothetical protein
MTLFASWWESTGGFIGRHPGLLLVLVGVAGEIFCDWREMTGKLALAKKTSAVLLVAGLLLEFNEAAKSDTEVARLGLQTAVAVAKATEANERTANLENEAAKARLDFEKLKESQWPRHFNPEQKREIISLLKQFPPIVVKISFPSSDSECIAYALDIKNTFETAGYTASLEPMAMVMGSPLGLNLWVLDPNHPPAVTPALQGLLLQLNIEAVWGPNGTVHKDELKILVNTRIPVLVPEGN